MTLIETYQAKVKAGELQADPAQHALLEILNTLAEGLVGYKPAANWLTQGLFGGNKSRPKGLYIYGGVGRGKSMLMDMFYDCVALPKKRRVHFHAFMQEVHSALGQTREKGIKDPIRPVCEAIAQSATVLCLDEMQITDITDAMLVGRLFENLMNSGVIIVTTSNRPPDDLYKDGLNRNLFVPFIELMKTRLQVITLDSQTDHRQNRLSDERRYFSPLSAKAGMNLEKLWMNLSGGHGKPMQLTVGSRQVGLPQVSNGVLRASFAELCGKALGAADYLKIAESFRVVFLENIPKLSKAKNNEAKRFVTLIDALYEAQVVLIASAADEPEKLYETGAGAFEFERTASRLREMQSADWGAVELV